MAVPGKPEGVERCKGCGAELPTTKFARALRRAGYSVRSAVGRYPGLDHKILGELTMGVPPTPQGEEILKPMLQEIGLDLDDVRNPWPQYGEEVPKA